MRLFSVWLVNGKQLKLHIIRHYDSHLAFIPPRRIPTWLLSRPFHAPAISFGFVYDADFTVFEAEQISHAFVHKQSEQVQIQVYELVLWCRLGEHQAQHI